MVILLIDPTANPQNEQSVESAKAMVQKVGNAAVNYNETEILYIAENWIAQEQTLDDGRKTVDLVKNRGHVHEQQGKDIVQICDIPKEHEQRRQHKPYADVKNHQTDNGVDEGEKMDTKGNMVEGRKHKIGAKGQAEVNERGNVFGQQKHILWHIDLADNAPVCHQCVHAAAGRFFEIGKDKVAAEQVCCVMWGIAAEELCKHQPHDQKRQQR